MGQDVQREASDGGLDRLKLQLQAEGESGLSREEIVERKKAHVAERRAEFLAFWEEHVRPFARAD